MCRNISLLMVWLTLYPFAGSSQTMGRLRGDVGDEATLKKITEATVIVSGPSTRTMTTDSTGTFSFHLDPGRYDLIIQHPDYQSVMRNNLQIFSSKENVQYFELEKREHQLPEINIQARPERRNEVSPFHLQQFAAVFYDPARVAATFAAAVGTNDQANHLSIGGTSPNYLQWKIEDVEVVSPNHLENSGTMNDRPAINGGGVSMLSAQLLSNSDLQFLPANAMQGNALSAVFDLKFRDGNSKRHEKLFQASFLGTDFAIEGPLSSKKRSSYLLNARYSTIGLLSGLGVDFSRENSTFGDFSHVVSLQTSKGNIRIFGLAGRSKTMYSGLENPEVAKNEKEIQDIRFDSSTLIEGVSSTQAISNTAFIKNVIAFSLKETRRRNQALHNFPWLEENDEIIRQQKISSLHYYSKRIGHSVRIRAGTHLNVFSSSLIRTSGNDLSDKSISQDLIQPFISTDLKFRRWEFRGGFHAFWLPGMNYLHLQPRCQVQFHINSENIITASYGRSAQLQPLLILLSNAHNNNLPPTRNDSYRLHYDYRFASTKIEGQLFLQHYHSVPTDRQSGFSAFNYFNEAVEQTLAPAGQAKSYGILLQLEKHRNGFYILPSLAIFEARYFISEEWRNGRYNTKYNAAITGGKEWRLKRRDRFIAFDLRFFRRNGFTEGLTEKNSHLVPYQLPPFTRLDLRLSYRRDELKYTSILALDIQNVSNEKNLAYMYYDRLSGKIEKQYQMGLLPVMSYKILF